MSEQQHRNPRRHGRGGRPSKGVRHSRTLRIPEDLDIAIEEAKAESGYATVNDLLVAILQNAQAAGLFPSAESSGQDRLPLSA